MVVLILKLKIILDKIVPEIELFRYLCLAILQTNNGIQVPMFQSVIMIKITPYYI